MTETPYGDRLLALLGELERLESAATPEARRQRRAPVLDEIERLVRSRRESRGQGGVFA